ncbi:hypothetical protein [Endozoicomonas sp.]|uniref:hypothetical protein n=1 Tax=Endozoicomonas sp. TaxID=1892382 RepID=UPI003AF900F4
MISEPCFFMSTEISQPDISNPDNSETEEATIEQYWKARLDAIHGSLMRNPDKARRIEGLLAERYELKNDITDDPAREKFAECALALVNCSTDETIDLIHKILETGWDLETSSKAAEKSKEDIEVKLDEKVMIQERQSCLQQTLKEHRALFQEETIPKMTQALRQFETQVSNGRGLGVFPEMSFDLSRPDEYAKFEAFRQYPSSCDAMRREDLLPELETSIIEVINPSSACNYSAPSKGVLL